ncbi:HlyD family efflux transporter periplasmic adaptor subunit [Actinoplanes couchii]|uniref:Peptidoglycan-binding protein n=1 Tax=Actinoplanes couchii TaxID=403638 RepID=A0ABQ3XEK7_9ACTN|nr:HlyD family efflux transporter periplasmic adaptor subunit [Actinoplanes couchii]MDR6319801.1 hypothetical protein [Actinoplanes couchii]GID56936.1 peptidoglycan-binding protein [Actinoplanes couchii]
MPFRKGPWAFAAAALTVAAAGAGFLSLQRAGGSPQSRPSASTATLSTAEVVRQDIATGRPLTGTVGYGPAWPVTAPGEGVVTWLPAVGTTVKRGEQAYRIDDRPVPVFYGKVPLFRSLDRANLVGRDVRIVADNLEALGYRVGSQPAKGTVVTVAPEPSVPPGPPVTVHAGEAVVTDGLIKAIKAWQRDRQLPETGTIARGDVLVQPRPIRVATVTARPGDTAGDELMTVTGTAKVIEVIAEVGDAGTVSTGDAVTVTVPGGNAKTGKVTAIGTAAGPDGGTPSLTITVTLTGRNEAARLDAAQVQVDFVTERHQDVLVVPVGALLALREGGYAVQLSGGALVAVRTGIIAKGLVEVSGDGLAEGATVVTTS